MNKKNFSINGMILSAGFGTRLKPIIGETPKPLAKLNFETAIIDTVIDNFLKSKISEITVNLHYKKEEIRDYLTSKFKQINFNFVNEKEILGTGGGILNCTNYLKKSDYTIISNSDILYNFDLNNCVQKHIQSQLPVSLLVFKNKDSRGICYNSQNKLTGFSGKNGEPLYGLQDFMSKDDFLGTFTGIHILSKEFFSSPEFSHNNGFFSIIDVYAKILLAGKKINIIPVDNFYWNDVGTPESFEKGKRDYAPFYHAKNLLSSEIKSWEVLFKGASEKQVCRIKYKDNSTVIATSTPSKKEVKAIYHFSNYLKNFNYPVPKVITKGENWLISEDGGEKNLLDILKTEKKLNKNLYKQAVDTIKLSTKLPLDKFPKEYCYQTTTFDFDNISADINYFNTWYTKGKLSKKDISTLAIQIFSELNQEQLSVMHRDFQSTNILINKENKLKVIDIQTMRKGYALYDLASLLFDSYIPFDIDFINDLVDYYFESETLKQSKEKTFYTAVLIRLLQNVGAFARFSEKTFFKDKLTPCKTRLKWLITEKANYIPSLSVKLLLDFF